MIASLFSAFTKRSSKAKCINLEEFDGIVYVIGDVHGCFDLLASLEEKIFQDAERKHGPKLLVYIGDIVDRGPNSFGVVEHLMSPPPKDFRRICLMGNHEEMMLRFIQKPGAAMEWLDFGGRETLLSYGALPQDLFFQNPKLRKLKALLTRLIPDEHIRFMSAMPHAVSLKEYFIAHAGVNPNLPLLRQSVRDMLWGAPGFLKARLDYRKTIVHGHYIEKRASYTNGRISIDTGAYASGRISAAKLTSDNGVEFITFDGNNRA